MSQLCTKPGSKAVHKQGECMGFQRHPRRGVRIELGGTEGLGGPGHSRGDGSGAMGRDPGALDPCIPGAAVLGPGVQPRGLGWEPCSSRVRRLEGRPRGRQGPGCVGVGGMGSMSMHGEAGPGASSRLGGAQEGRLVQSPPTPTACVQRGLCARSKGLLNASSHSISWRDRAPNETQGPRQPQPLQEEALSFPSLCATLISAMRRELPRGLSTPWRGRGCILSGPSPAKPWESPGWSRQRLGTLTAQAGGWGTDVPQYL